MLVNESDSNVTDLIGTMGVRMGVRTCYSESFALTKSKITSDSFSNAGRALEPRLMCFLQDRLLSNLLMVAFVLQSKSRNFQRQWSMITLSS